MYIKDENVSIFVMKNICCVNERSKGARRKSIHYKWLVFINGQWGAFRDSLPENHN